MAIRILFISILFLSALLIYIPVISELLKKQKTTTLLIGLFIASRLLGWFGSYMLIENLVQSSDLMLYYFNEAAQAYQGKIPYIDYPSSYGPVYPYIVGLLLPYWQQPAAIALIIICIEITAVLTFLKISLQQPDTERFSINIFLYIYLIHPAALYWSGMMAYNSSFVLLFWISIVYLLANNKYLLSLLSMGFSLLMSKFLSILAAPLLLAHPSRHFASIAIAGMFFITIYFTSKYFGMDLLSPLMIEGGRSTSGNIWFLLSGLISFDNSGYFWRFAPALIMLSGICVFSFICFKCWDNKPTLVQLCAAFSAVGWIFMLLSKKTFPHYTPMFLMFTIYAFSVKFSDQKKWIILIMVLGGAGILEPGLWNALGQPMLLNTVPLSANYLLILLFDIVLLTSYIYMLKHSIQIALGQK